MTYAVLRLADESRLRHGGVVLAVIGRSLGREFAARAATEDVNAFRSVALISPTGFDQRSVRAARKPGAGRTRAMPWLHSLLAFPLWKSGIFSALTSRASIRFFLEKTWGGKQ